MNIQQFIQFCTVRECEPVASFSIALKPPQGYSFNGDPLLSLTEILPFDSPEFSWLIAGCKHDPLESLTKIAESELTSDG